MILKWLYGLLVRTVFLIAILSLLSATQTVQAEIKDDRELQSLISLLDSQTEVATKNRMNADYIPGMATILLGEDLRVRGARTVWEALELVPGISLGMEFTGERQVLSRGIGHGYASGNIKILLDGVSMNSTLLATANPILNLPIEQIARIEVIRGPGSSVYGEYAYAGVVNVITLRDKPKLYTYAESESHYAIGGLWMWRDKKNDLELSLNLSGLHGDGHDINVDEDAWYHIGQPELSNAPGPTNEAQQHLVLFFDLNWYDFYVSVKLLDDAYGDHFGINHFLPPPDDRLSSRQKYRTLGLGGKRVLSETLEGKVRFEYKEHERNRDQLFVYPANFFTPYPIFMDSTYEEQTYILATDINWQPNPMHNTLLSLEISDTSIKDAGWSWPELSLPLPGNWIDTTMRRHLFAVLAQDQYRLSDALTLTGTLRHDDYGDVDNSFSPRLATVWCIEPDRILKFQLARAFRPPTFFELQNPGQNKVETSAINTVELGYIVKKPNWRGSLILFHSDLEDPIIFDELNFKGYINEQDAKLQGFEFEYLQRIGNHLKIDTNLSYVNARFRSTGNKLPGGAKWLANLELFWKPVVDWTSSIQLHYVGERHRSNFDSRSHLAASTSLDFTVSYLSSTPGLQLYLGVKNLTNEDIRYPQQLTTDFSGDPFLPYPDDYPRPGRRWWLSLSYDI
ncbi:MAG: TonB-dependent receptor [Candidatus Thiodiazotropha sp. (ex Lucinoma aequizonata)]|nr:TonB-dependent receptor [Candidatus Thiodiazotropha sp. (ex Lucinoma aequizonata)]MCU7887333.1 TonB-dependent receptor [Candidatus Thiodiazotropha sp. (ex Lucinoma aequizonata)]MCU7895768.1 TonB-dependent receptor [Candidatus Thiodiazotropha sp. (ex Lucinoma aequizonata)]MCU7897217.1 TonB-dependent receptor [Candidatus Thiodiazotropha sp. (ex Lucinoma aequizonata)]MCU7903366.1 TonB-dependent receptor [Candidatus Thiodiazotropha sp. (ex Lucinoma aequizonata)]